MTHCRQVDGIGRRGSHLIKGVCVVYVVCPELCQQFGQEQRTDALKKGVTGLQDIGAGITTVEVAPRT